LAEDLVVAGSKNLHTWSKTIGASLVADEFVLPGEFPYATYRLTAANISIATLNDHVIQLMAGSSLNVRLRYFRVVQAGNAATAALASFGLFRLTTAGTGGTAITPRPHDSADSASGATGMTLPSGKGTEGVQLDQTRLPMRQAFLATSTQVDGQYVWQQGPFEKPIIIPAGTTNGLAIKSQTAIAGASVDVVMVFVETAFV
jgi:hypothetical protein